MLPAIFMSGIRLKQKRVVFLPRTTTKQIDSNRHVIEAKTQKLETTIVKNNENSRI